MFWTGAAD